MRERGEVLVRNGGGRSLSSVVQLGSPYSIDVTDQLYTFNVIYIGEFGYIHSLYSQISSKRTKPERRKKSSNFYIFLIRQNKQSNENKSSTEQIGNTCIQIYEVVLSISVC